MSIELVNFIPADSDPKMTQVEPAQPVKPERVDVILPKPATDTSEFSHISLHQVRSILKPYSASLYAWFFVIAAIVAFELS